MRVAVIIDTWFPLIGGGQINSWEISRRIAQKGVLIDLITRDNGPDDLKSSRNLKIFKIGPRAKPENLLSKLFFGINVFFFAYHRNYDLIHGHAFIPGISAWFLKVFKKVPVIFTVHGTSINTSLNNQIWEFIEKFILTKIPYSAQITVSRDFLKIPNINKKIFYTPNGVDLKKFDKIKTRKFKNPTLIFVGRLHPQKNLSTLIISFIQLIKNSPHLKLIIVGTGLQREKLLKLIKNLHLQNSIKMMGEVTGDRLIKLYKSCHLFILPSIYEGQPLTLLEAWGAKLPVIVSNTGDCRFLVKNNYNGYLINNPRSSDEITNIIKKALTNKNLAKLGQAGYNLVKQKFSWGISAKETLQLYRNVIKSKN